MPPQKNVIPSAAEGPAFRSFAVDACVSPHLQLVQQERRFYFIGRTKREILFTTQADSLDEARQKSTIRGGWSSSASIARRRISPRNAGHPDADALFIIKTETEIYLA